MNDENDLTLHGWFAGEDSRMFVHRDHENYRFATLPEHSKVKREFFGDHIYSELLLFNGKPYQELKDGYIIGQFANYGDPGKRMQEWDYDCIRCYSQILGGDNAEFIKGFDKFYEAECCDIDCHRCGINLHPLNKGRWGDLCEQCEFEMSEEYERPNRIMENW